MEGVQGSDCHAHGVLLMIGAIRGLPDGMNYPAVSRGVSSSVLACHSVLDTPAPYVILGNPVGTSRYRLSPV